MILDALTREDAEQIRKWRNRELRVLRTPYPLTPDQQQAWYTNNVANRSANARWWAIRQSDELVGYVGIQHISWENRTGEISLLVSPNERGKGYGGEAVKMAVSEAFYNMGLDVVWGEVYECGNVQFWRRLVETYNGKSVAIPWTVKRCDNKVYGSLMFAWERHKWSAQMGA